MLLGLATHKLTVDDLPAARAWYARVLGQEPYFDQPFYVGFALGGYELGIVPAQAGDRPGDAGTTAYWRVTDLDAAWAALLAAGATVAEPLAEVGGGIRIGAVRDPFGNRLGLIHNPHFAVPSLDAVVVAQRPLAAPDGALAPAEVHCHVVVPLDRMAAWSRFMSAQAVTGWLGVETRIEPRIGGAWELLFRRDLPAGSQGSEGVRILSFLPGRMLSFTWNAPPEQPVTRPQHTWVVLAFSDAAAGCRVDLHHTGWPAHAWRADGSVDPASPWAETFAYFTAAWPRLLGAFAASCGG